MFIDPELIPKPDNSELLRQRDDAIERQEKSVSVHARWRREDS